MIAVKDGQPWDEAQIHALIGAADHVTDGFHIGQE